nr:MAG TPA: hypothetical protein [Caudoviricetes sp.]
MRLMGRLCLFATAANLVCIVRVYARMRRARTASILFNLKISVGRQNSLYRHPMKIRSLE